jgi:transcriptional regulator with XRE-family HTH domain
MNAASRRPLAFAAVLKRHRMLKKLSQEELAEAAGVHHTYVSLVERGARNPTLAVADSLASALGVKLSALVAEAERGRLK